MPSLQRFNIFYGPIFISINYFLLYFQLLEDPVPQVEMTDPFIVPGYPADESVVYLNGWGVLRFRIQFPPGNAILYENTKVNRAHKFII